MHATEPALDRPTIRSVYQVIQPHVRLTPILQTNGGDVGLSAFPLTLKLEQLQHAGSFKTRGAFTNLLCRSIPPAGVIAASGGNHGVAVAYAAGRLGIRARIFVPSVASPSKIERIRRYGADLTIVGDLYHDALVASERALEESQALAIHAFDQVETLLGQATLGLELTEQADDLETLLVSVGGGGLIGGIAAWYAGEIRLVGVEPEAAPTLSRALQAGRPVDAPAGGLAAESLAPRAVGELMFPLAQRYVDRVLLVDDASIRAAQERLWDVFRIVAEPGGATAFAALLNGSYRPEPGERVGVVVSGGNTRARF
jgi:threonine dehydratase